MNYDEAQNDKDLNSYILNRAGQITKNSIAKHIQQRALLVYQAITRVEP